MKFAVALSFVTLALANVVEKRACAGNNCNRAITGTRDGLSPASVRSADCKSFLLTTVTPSAVTVTITVDEAAATPAKRDAGLLAVRAATVIPTSLPTYATAACDAAAYASACVCYGVTASVTTAPVPTTTVTTTIDYCDDL